MPAMFIESEQDAMLNDIRRAVIELDRERLADLVEHAARLLEQQKAEK